MTVEELPEYLKQHGPEIGEQLRNGSYQPQPVRRVEILKPDGSGVRKLGIQQKRWDRRSPNTATVSSYLGSSVLFVSSVVNHSFTRPPPQLSQLSTKQKAGACSAQVPASIFSFVIEKSVLPIGLAELPRDHLAISRVVDEVVPRGRLGHLGQLPLGLLQALYGSYPERLAIR
jgi:hypothetical protein